MMFVVRSKEVSFTGFQSSTEKVEFNEPIINSAGQCATWGQLQDQGDRFDDAARGERSTSSLFSLFKSRYAFFFLF